LAVAAVPHPAGGPHQTDRVDQAEDDAEGSQGEAKQLIFFALRSY
jgi:hypothetical protein